MTQSNEPQGKSFLTKLLLVIVIGVVVGALIVGAIAIYNNSFALEKATPIENFFVDINGDGLLDFVRYAKVIINTGNLNLIPSP